MSNIRNGIYRKAVCDNRNGNRSTMTTVVDRMIRKFLAPTRKTLKNRRFVLFRRAIWEHVPSAVDVCVWQNCRTFVATLPPVCLLGVTLTNHLSLSDHACDVIARCAHSMHAPDPWLTCDHFVGKASAMGQPTRPTQPSIPPGSVNE